MTDERIEVDRDEYESLKDAYMQMRCEGWINVRRESTDAVEARPVDRQEERKEGEYITSDQWVIREENGDTYTVSGETFNDVFYTDPIETRDFMLDLSFKTETEDGEVLMSRDDRVKMRAYVNMTTSVVEEIDVIGSTVGDTDEWYDGVSIDLLKDHPDVTPIENDG